MAQTVMTVQQLKAPFAAVVADGFDISMAALDATNGNSFQCTGKELLIIRNSGASSRTLTISSVADEHGRSGDVSAYTIAAGDVCVFPQGLTTSKGWQQPSGVIHILGSHAELLAAVVRLP